MPIYWAGQEWKKLPPCYSNTYLEPNVGVTQILQMENTRKMKILSAGNCAIEIYWWDAKSLNYTKNHNEYKTFLQFPAKKTSIMENINTGIYFIISEE